MAGEPGPHTNAPARQLLASAHDLRWRAPELAWSLCDRVVARSDGDRSARFAGETFAAFSANRLGRPVAAVGHAVSAARELPSVDAADPAALTSQNVRDQLYVELGWCSGSCGNYDLARHVLTSVLRRDGVDPAVRAHGLMAWAAAFPAQDRAEVLTEAERLYAAGAESDGTHVALARVAGVRATHHRRQGAFVAAVDATKDGLSRLDRLVDPTTDNGEVRARLTLERVQGLLELGRRAEGIQLARGAVAEPPRAAAAPYLVWLGLVLATRVHAPAGEFEAAIRVLHDSTAVAEHHALSGLAVETLRTLSTLHERVADMPAALRLLRAAFTTDRQWRAGWHAARTQLLTELPSVLAELEGRWPADQQEPLPQQRRAADDARTAAGGHSGPSGTAAPNAAATPSAIGHRAANGHGAASGEPGRSSWPAAAAGAPPRGEQAGDSAQSAPETRSASRGNRRAPGAHGQSTDSSAHRRADTSSTRSYSAQPARNPTEHEQAEQFRESDRAGAHAATHGAPAEAGTARTAEHRSADEHRATASSAASSSWDAQVSEYPARSADSGTASPGRTAPRSAGAAQYAGATRDEAAGGFGPAATQRGTEAEDTRRPGSTWQLTSSGGAESGSNPNPPVRAEQLAGVGAQPVGDVRTMARQLMETLTGRAAPAETDREAADTPATAFTGRTGHTGPSSAGAEPYAEAVRDDVATGSGPATSAGSTTSGTSSSAQPHGYDAKSHSAPRTHEATKSAEHRSAGRSGRAREPDGDQAPVDQTSGYPASGYPASGYPVSGDQAGRGGFGTSRGREPDVDRHLDSYGGPDSAEPSDAFPGLVESGAFDDVAFEHGGQPHGLEPEWPVWSDVSAGEAPPPRAQPDPALPSTSIEDIEQAVFGVRPDRTTAGSEGENARRGAPGRTGAEHAHAGQEHAHTGQEHGRGAELPDSGRRHQGTSLDEIRAKLTSSIAQLDETADQHSARRRTRQGDPAASSATPAGEDSNDTDRRSTTPASEMLAHYLPHQWRPTDPTSAALSEGSEGSGAAVAGTDTGHRSVARPEQETVGAWARGAPATGPNDLSGREAGAADDSTEPAIPPVDAPTGRSVDGATSATGEAGADRPSGASASSSSRTESPVGYSPNNGHPHSVEPVADVDRRNSAGTANIDSPTAREQLDAANSVDPNSAGLADLLAGALAAYESSRDGTSNEFKTDPTGFPADEVPVSISDNPAAAPGQDPAGADYAAQETTPDHGARDATARHRRASG